MRPSCLLFAVMATCFGSDITRGVNDVGIESNNFVRKDKIIIRQIKSTNVNVALRRPSWLSSTYQYRSAHLAVDGIRETNGLACATTNGDVNPWWAVDLGVPVLVRGVSFLNRIDYSERANHFIVGLTNISVQSQTPVPWKYAICGRYPGSVPGGQSAYMECAPYSPAARYVIIQLERTDYLTICELEIYAQDVVKPPENVKLCPSSFTYMESVRGCYHVVFENLEWEIAGLRCKRLHKDAHLIVINNHAEQAAVASMMASHPASSFSFCRAYEDPTGTPFWTAGQRVDPTRESPFVWNIGGCDGKSEMTYMAWAQGQPNNAAAAEGCLQMAHGRGYAWNDGNCSIAFCSICEIDM